jgi:glycosyltransferase involved in cell wall biosynthesis
MESLTQYPLISIGIPTYNRSKGVCRALDSVWKQNYPHLEVVISDNCSSDNTYGVVQEIKQEHPELNYVRQEKNIGMMANFEFVLRKATGKYFIWLADDDILEAGVLLKYNAYLEEHAECALVSGQIKYWLDDKQDLSESGFTFEQKSSSLRVLGYYAKVVYGGMMHGLMRRSLTQDISLRQVIGNDYHFIANLAYLGEIKHFEYVGYHKNLGGTSQDFKQYARHMGDSDFAAHFPHLKMACDAFAEIMYRSNVYAELPIYSRFTLAISSFTGMLFRYYGTIFPFMIGGKIKRLITRSAPWPLKPSKQVTNPETAIDGRSSKLMSRGSWYKINSSRLTG